MKLYQTYASPFPTRVRLLLIAKGIGVEIVEPLAALPKLAAYWRAIQKDPIAARLIGETRAAIEEQKVLSRRLADARTS